MKQEYKIDLEAGMVHVEYEGALSAREVVESIERIVNDPSYKKGLDALVNVAGAAFDWDHLELTFLKNYTLQVFQKKVGVSKWAVVTPDIEARGLAKVISVMIEALGSSIMIRAFPQRDIALEWLREKKTA